MCDKNRIGYAHPYQPLPAWRKRALTATVLLVPLVLMLMLVLSLATSPRPAAGSAPAAGPSPAPGAQRYAVGSVAPGGVIYNGPAGAA